MKHLPWSRLIVLLPILSSCAQPLSPQPTVFLSSEAVPEGFARATSPQGFEFPLDHGPHEAFQTEWWYYTGNLDTAEGRHFGFQLTFFRRGLTPGLLEGRESTLATNQIYFAHFAITDVDGVGHRFAERFSRGAGGLAGARGEPFGVWLDDWSAEAVDEAGEVIRLKASEGGVAIDLTLTAVKPVVTHGDRGLSPKSDEPGNASYYLSFTNMRAEGEVHADGRDHTVIGEAWFDHEWSTSALGPQAVGWDWFSLQLDDGRELMFFQIRRDDGTLEPASGGTLVEPDGSTVRLGVDQVQIEVLDTWRSPETGAIYPSRWRILIPSNEIELEVTPWVAAQEMRVSFVYWEGAVRFMGTSRGANVAGNGYVEMTGYAGSVRGRF